MTRSAAAAYNARVLPLLAALVAAAPPPAYVVTPTATIRLAQSSYCWHMQCGDYIAARCGDGRTPEIRVRRGASIRFRLAFTPTQLLLGFLGAAARDAPLAPARMSRYRVARGGAFVLFARTARGYSTSYAGCLRLR